MKSRIFSMAAAAVLAGCLVVCPVGCGAQDLAEPPQIGAALPGFELPDLDGKLHTLEQYRGKIVVIEMASQHCPWSRGADPHLVELANKYADKNVVFLGVDSHNSTSAEDIKKYAEEKKKTYTILKDEGNKYADALGARTTPEVYVVDKDGKLVYHGAFDNRSNPDEKGDKPYVDMAIQAAIEGKSADPDRVKSWGCSIKRK
ncbi:MAG TPA: redoxin domain-containing protein [Candidatus Hydrogenedentes bacterium]|nr:redoxin domain-containing protein [Candidatus Hydrogenedentota bacterium]